MEAESTKLTNQEKSARRYQAMNGIAELFAAENKEFHEFTWDENEQKYTPTWRKMETFLKRKFESGAKIRIVIESASGGV